MPGTFGDVTDTSFAQRRIPRDDAGAAAPKAITVVYGRRGTFSGSCRNPHVAFYDLRTDAAAGDPGARLTIETSGDMQANAVAHWSLLGTAAGRVCRVAGYDTAGKAWAVQGQDEGSHTLHEDTVVGTHSTPLVYLYRPACALSPANARSSRNPDRTDA
jgi:hypothetical protein